MSDENVKVDSWAYMNEGDAKKLVGKTISGVIAKEFSIKLTFTDGSGLLAAVGTETLWAEYDEDAESLD